MLAETLPHLLAGRAERHPERPALIDSVAKLTSTYAELAQDAERLGTSFASRLTSGSRIAVLADQTAEVWTAMHGALRASVVPVLLNWRLTQDDLTAIAQDAGCAEVWSTPRWEGAADALAATLGVEHHSVASLVDADAAPVDAAPPPWPCAEDAAVQLYTSGTTSLPKGVCLTHRNVLALLDTLTSELPGFSSDTRHLVTAPLFHIAGFGFGVGPLAVGAPSVLLDQFEPNAVLDLIERERITHTLLVPAMLQMVVAVEGAADRDTSSLRGLLYGGSPMSVSLMTRVAEVLGCPMTQAYGLTETSGIATMLRYDDHARGLAEPDGPARDRLSSAGRPLLGTEVRIAADGEVLVRSPMVMPGYWRRPEATEAALDADGWLHTGDVGRLDEDGYLHIVDRKNDIVITKGENVYPGEVERVLAEHPDVRDVAVIGVPDDAYGEVLCAVVERRDGAEAPTLAELQAFSRERLAGFKVPRRVEVVDELPRTPSGKVLRRVVRAPYWAGQARQVN